MEERKEGMKGEREGGREGISVDEYVEKLEPL